MGAINVRFVPVTPEALDSAPLTAVDLEWVAEAKRRLADVEAGRCTPIAAKEAFERIRNALRR